METEQVPQTWVGRMAQTLGTTEVGTTMKCYWCYQLSERGAVPYVNIRAAVFVFNGESVCEEHLDLLRRVGRDRVLAEGLMS
jgi:hypothetical protein